MCNVTNHVGFLNSKYSVFNFVFVVVIVFFSWLKLSCFLVMCQYVNILLTEADINILRMLI